jgi:hypothetical protein
VPSGLLRHLHLVVALVWLATSDGHGNLDGAAGWLVAAVGAWLLTSIGRFRILGEAERYLEFVFPVSWVLLWTLVASADRAAWATGVGVVFAAVYAGNIVLVRRMAAERPVDRRHEASAQLARRNPLRILVTDVTEALAFAEDAHEGVVMYNGQQTVRGEVGAFIDRLLLRYPYVDPSRATDFVADFDVTHLVVRKASEERVVAEAGHGYDLAGFAVVYENADYRVLERAG